MTTEIDTYPSFSQEDDLQFVYKRDAPKKRVENKLRTKSVENHAKNKSRAKNSQYMTHQMHASNEYDARKYHQNIIKGMAKEILRKIKSINRISFILQYW